MAFRNKQVADTLERLASAEKQFAASEFLAPTLGQGIVQVRIAQIVCSLRVPRFVGFGVFRPISSAEAAFMRAATLAERRRYLDLFPRLRMILVSQHDEAWWASPAHAGDARFRIEHAVPIHLVEEAQRFDGIEARFDGANFWFAAPDDASDAATARYLRDALSKLTPTDQLARSGLTAQQRAAYDCCYRIRYEATEDARRGREEQRIQRALAHAGAELKEFVERHDVYTVSFEVDGRRHVSAVSKKDLSVQTAGICLSGEDEKFDLASLVGVLREADEGVVRVGPENRGMAEADYWRVHPRRL
jgi:hypothetical protein